MLKNTMSNRRSSVVMLLTTLTLLMTSGPFSGIVSADINFKMNLVNFHNWNLPFAYYAPVS